MAIFKSSHRKNKTETLKLNSTIKEICAFFGVNDISEIGVSELLSVTYFSCMQIRCNALAKLPFKVMQYKTEGAEELTQHPLSDLLKLRPNYFTSAHDFMWATEFQRIHFGNAIWVYEFSGGKIKSLYLLDSERVEIVVDNTCLLSNQNDVYYIYHDPKNGNVIYKSEQVAHFKFFPTNGITGTPISQYIAKTVNQEKYAQNVINNKYKSGLQDPIVVTYTGDVDESRRNKIKRKFEAMGGVENAGKVIPIPSEFDIKTLETKLVNSQFFELNGLTTKHIANAFGVKSFQLNDLEKSTYNNIEAQNQAFYSDTLENPVIKYEQEITYKLLFNDERKKGIYVHCNTDAMLRSDILTRYRAYEIGIQNGFKMISECRKKEGDPFIGGTDKLIIGNGASIPLDMLGKQYGKGVTGNE